MTMQIERELQSRKDKRESFKAKPQKGIDRQEGERKREETQENRDFS